MKILIHTYKNIFNYSGRASRKEFWLFFLYNFIIFTLLVFLSALLAATLKSEMMLVSLLSVLKICGFISLLANIALCVRRLHDLSYKGWWVIVALIPLVNIVFLLICGFKKGIIGTNVYGAESEF